MTAGPGIACALREAGYLLAYEQRVHQKDYLPKPPELTNPLVRQALHEVRKVVNAIIRTFGKPAQIHIEMAREVRGTKLQRDRHSEEIRERARRKDDSADRIRETGVKATADAIDRYLLWDEQKHLCVYSGQPISLAQLLGGEVDKDHILPFSRSLDNSLMNQVVCFRSENSLKGNRTPYEWLGESNPAKFDEILQRAGKLPYGKARKFREKFVKLDDFIARQLVDTSYITSQVQQYVRCLGVDVICSKGQLTAELRRHWGLNDILRDDGLNLKNREDHRHHAVDAIVIALTNRSRLQQLAGIRRQGGTERTGEVLSDPWPNFRADIKNALDSINVSHRVRRKVFGPLHKEMQYGTTVKPNSGDQKRPWASAWVEEEHTYVRRKSVSELSNTKQLAKVRDNTIREILKGFLRDRQIDPDRPQKIPSSVWKEQATMPSGVPIKKVRMLEHGDGFVEIHRGSYAELSSNHHYEIVDLLDETGQPSLDSKGAVKRKGYLVTMFEAAKRARIAQEEFKKVRQALQSLKLTNDELKKRLAAEVARISRQYAVIRKDHGPREGFVMSLSINELFDLELEDGIKRLHRVQKMSEGSIILRPHTYAGEVSDTDKPPIIQRRGPNTLRGEKVVVDCIGRIRSARD
jgi:CRISPR-associated endonuclease Csn1